MKRLSKKQKQQRADLVTRLNDAAEAVRAALAAVNAEIACKLNSAIENYNLVVSVVGTIFLGNRCLHSLASQR